MAAEKSGLRKQGYALRPRAPGHIDISTCSRPQKELHKPKPPPNHYIQSLFPSSNTITQTPRTRTRRDFPCLTISECGSWWRVPSSPPFACRSGAVVEASQIVHSMRDVRRVWEGLPSMREVPRSVVFEGMPNQGSTGRQATSLQSCRHRSRNTSYFACVMKLSDLASITPSISCILVAICSFAARSRHRNINFPTIILQSMPISRYLRLFTRRHSRP